MRFRTSQTLLAILPDRGTKSDGWDRAWWFYASCRLLGGAKPVDAFADAPKRVIDAAIAQFRKPKEAAW
ncbi:hypothetical protein [Burkholderia sp. Ac-20365]|uniref:hypothetical protein n=1 Tax=Burkholderia sp. Ac-20365 TaxID=2703897 RepID=UPI00197C9C05|nr:hypothetical protein [Burkholderia sp. Ac-20365]MBN3762330.1 hypothetical protein [Burkholderia sp. Ac-20365]